MAYSYSDWNNKQGTIPVQWLDTDYTTLPWRINPDKNQGFTTPKKRPRKSTKKGHREKN